jgi:signal transduction histidine kinase
MVTSQGVHPLSRRETGLDAVVGSAWSRYGLALVAVAAALVGRWSLDPALGDFVPYSLLYAVVAFSAIYLGLGPSIAVMIGGLLGTAELFVPPRGSLAITGAPHFAEAVTYLGVCSIIIAAGEGNRRYKARLRSALGELEKSEEALRAASEKLEKRVEERTAELRETEESARQLGGQILKMQDDERRRIARELHDSVGQILSALAINLGQLKTAVATEREAQLLGDSRTLIESATSELRTMSHLLHPPLLDELGLSSAVEWYVEEFSKRSGVATELNIEPGFGRLSFDYEIAIFRIIQECLTNVHRHSGSPTARVSLTKPTEEIRVEVSDAGRGIPAKKQAGFANGGAMGVGLRGMNERVQQLGGRMEIRSSSSGTLVTAILPREGAGEAGVSAGGEATAPAGASEKREPYEQ